jgi:hypothetical protein
VPRYLSLVANRIGSTAGRQFEILQNGHLNPDMTSHGGRPELAPYPDWAAVYLVHREPAQAEYVLANGDLAGSWPVHIREPLEGRYKGLGFGRLVSIDERPNFWLDTRAGPEDKPAGDLNGLGPLKPDNAHVPSLAYVPYLITGDRYYAEELAFWADYVLLRTFQDSYYKARGGNQGLLESNETRGIAWGLRNLTDAAAYLPDDEPAKAYLATKVVNNLEWADRYAETHVTPLSTYFERKEPGQSAGNGRATISVWQNNYVSWALDHANRQGFPGGTKLRDRLARFQLNLFTSPDYPVDYAAPYYPTIGALRPDQSISHFPSLKQVFEATYGRPPDKPTPFVGYYGVDARLILLIARCNAWAGADKAYRYLFATIGKSERKDGVSDLSNRAGWAIASDDEP